MRMFAKTGLGALRAGAALAAMLVAAPTIAADSSTPTKGSAVADYGIPQVKRINEEIRRVWTDNNLSPSSVATDGEWCRRVYLDLLGRVPSVEELREFTI